MAVGFLLAVRSVVANDAISFFGTFIAANPRTPWPIMWAGASAVLLAALWIGWAVNDGDISYGRLASIPFVEVRWYHALAPAVLLVLTRYGIPVSTSFLVLSAFASGPVMEQMLIKSAAGYGIAALVGFGVWRLINQKLNDDPIPESQRLGWTLALWPVTGFLLWTWLSHDFANIAVFLPRQVSVSMMIFVSMVFVGGLAWTFKERGGRIQKLVSFRRNIDDPRSATIVSLVYACVLLVFKELNDIPMSTTFVFLGLLGGRELAIVSRQDVLVKPPTFIVRDLIVLTIGVAVVSVVYLVQGIIMIVGI